MRVSKRGDSETARAEDDLKYRERRARNYERLVGKDPASPYSGGRTLKRLKVKNGVCELGLL